MKHEYTKSQGVLMEEDIGDYQESESPLNQILSSPPNEKVSKSYID